MIPGFHAPLVVTLIICLVIGSLFGRSNGVIAGAITGAVVFLGAFAVDFYDQSVFLQGLITQPLTGAIWGALWGAIGSRMFSDSPSRLQEQIPEPTPPPVVIPPTGNSTATIIQTLPLGVAPPPVVIRHSRLVPILFVSVVVIMAFVGCLVYFRQKTATEARERHDQWIAAVRKTFDDGTMHDIRSGASLIRLRLFELSTNKGVPVAIAECEKAEKELGAGADLWIALGKSLDEIKQPNGSVEELRDLETRFLTSAKEHHLSQAGAYQQLFAAGQSFKEAKNLTSSNGGVQGLEPRLRKLGLFSLEMMNEASKSLQQSQAYRAKCDQLRAQIKTVLNK